jgi:hypothetical protein
MALEQTPDHYVTRMPQFTNHGDTYEPLTESPLQVVELLEQILSNLSPKELFKVQRTCRKWNDVMKDSVTLKRKMWLASSSHAVLKPIEGSVTCLVIDEGVRLHSDSLTPNQLLSLASQPTGFEQHVDCVTLHFNPLLKLHGPWDATPSWDMVHSDLGFALKRRHKPLDGIRLSFKYLRQNWQHQTWNQTLLTDPPCTMLEITHFTCPGKPIHLERLTGITLRDVVEAAIKCRLYVNGYPSTVVDYYTSIKTTIPMDSSAFEISFGGSSPA